MPTVYWFCPKPDAPSGGVWLIHRLANLLNQAGATSRVLMKEPFQVWWDAHPVVDNWGYLSAASFSAGDTLVVPEVCWPMKVPVGVRSILFLQNYIWLDDAKRAELRAHPETEILVCSRYLANWCIRELLIRPIGIVTPFLDDDVWAKEDKVTGSVILFARRNPELAEQLYTAIGRAGYDVHMQREPVSQREIRKLFNHREFYLHHVEPEGFPMAALEAMRCGVIPVGTTGGGGNEFMYQGETAMVTPGRLMGHYADPQIFVDKVLGLLAQLRDDADLRSRMWIAGEAWSQRYTAQATTAQLLKVFG